MSVAIRAQGVGIRFVIRHHRNPTVHSGLIRFLKGKEAPEEFWALRDIDLEVKTGQVLGIIGANGSGKSTLLRVLARIYAPDAGEIEIRGKTSALISLGAGFNANLTGLENIFYNGMLLGLTRQQIQSRLDEIVEFAELGRFINAPVRTYSSGMRARLGFSVAVHVDPEILIVDEVLAVGDARFRQKCKAKFDEFFQRGLTVVMVQHNLYAIVELCDEAIWLDRGHLRARGNPLDICNQYLASQGLDLMEPPKSDESIRAGYESHDAAAGSSYGGFDSNIG